MAPALPWEAAAAWSRLAWVGYSPLMLAVVTASTATIENIQTGIRTRSRRKMKRVSWAVPVRLVIAWSGPRLARGLALDQRVLARQFLAVLSEEELLERGWMADEALDPELAKAADRRVEMIAVHVEADMGTVDHEAMDPGQVRQSVGGTRGVRRNRGAGQVPQLPQRAALHPAPRTYDAEPVAERLDLRQDVTGQQHRPTLRLDLADAVLKHRFHER